MFKRGGVIKIYFFVRFLVIGFCDYKWDVFGINLDLFGVGVGEGCFIFNDFIVVV